MNIHGALKGILLPACLSATTNSRNRLVEATMSSATAVSERTKLAVKRFQKAGWTHTQISTIVEAMVLIAHGRDALKDLRVESFLESSHDLPVLDPLTVIRIVGNHASHNIPMGSLCIVTTGKSRGLLGPSGSEFVYSYTTAHNDVAIATDLEVENCIDGLTLQQVRYILADQAVFAPVLTELYSPQQQSASTTTDTPS